MKILLADDTPEIRKVLSDLLKGYGHFVVEAKDGHEALCFLGYHKDVDLIITDLEMPVWNGLKFAEEAKKICKAPIILHTGKPDTEPGPNIEKVIGKGQWPAIKAFIDKVESQWPIDRSCDV